MFWEKVVGLNIRRARKEFGLSQEQLAHKADMDMRYLGGIERGEYNPTVAMYPNTKYRAGDNLRLRAPIADRILLAGEALAEDFGYVDSAWSDGRRAADLLIA